MVYRRRNRRKITTGRVALFALGAIAGLTLGMALAQRIGGIDGLRKQGGQRHRRNGWRNDHRRSESFSELPDDHSELAPEAISHLHLADQLVEREPGLNKSRRETHARARHFDHTNSADGVQSPDPLNELEERVLEAFRNDPILAHSQIDIGAVGPGEVELTGWVAAPSDIRLAAIVARGVPGVERVISSSLVTDPDAPGM